MGREISCEIALKKGAKREGNGRDPQQGKGQQQHQAEASRQESGTKATTKPTRDTASSTYGGGGAVGGERTGARPAPTAASSKMEKEVAHVAANRGAPGKVIVAKADDGDTPKPKASSREGKLAAAIAAAEATGLGKKEARKAARKAMKKELKEKAKERAREKKEEQAKLDAAAPAPAVAVAAAKAAPSTAAAGTGDGEAGDGEDEPVDPKAAKLAGDAKTLLIFGIADDLTAKQLQKRVKKVRSRRIQGALAQ